MSLPDSKIIWCAGCLKELQTRTLCDVCGGGPYEGSEQRWLQLKQARGLLKNQGKIEAKPPRVRCRSCRNSYLKVSEDPSICPSCHLDGVWWILEEEDPGFLKFDAKKPRLDLVPPRALMDVELVLAYGAEKYHPDNWHKTDSWRRYIRAVETHVQQFKACEDFDDQSKLSHLSHAICSLLFLRELQILGMTAADDRFRPPSAASTKDDTNHE